MATWPALRAAWDGAAARRLGPFPVALAVAFESRLGSPRLRAPARGEAPGLAQRETAMTTEPSAPSAAALRLFDTAVVIDGLDTSNWGKERIFRDLRDGGVTAVNATSAIWEGFQETLDNLTTWLRWFEDYAAYIRPVHRVADIHAAKAEGRTGIILAGRTRPPWETTCGASASSTRWGARRSTHLQRAESLRERLLGARRRGLESHRSRRDSRDEPPWHPDRSLSRGGSHGAGNDRTLRAARGIHPRERTFPDGLSTQQNR